MLYINDHSMFKSVNVEPYLCISLDCYFYRPQGKVMFSQASVSHSVHNQPHGYSVIVHPCYGMVGMHTGMLSCYRLQRNWGKVIFSEVSVKNSVHSGGV